MTNDIRNRFRMRFEVVSNRACRRRVGAGSVEAGACLVADAESFELVEPGEGALDDPPGLSRPGAVRGTAPGDHRCDPTGADETAVLVEVVAAIGPRTANAGHSVQERHELGDVVTVSAGAPSPCRPYDTT